MADIISELNGIGIDTSGALARLCGNRDMLLKYLFRLPEEQYIPAYKQEFDAENFKTAAERIHEFKGVAGNLGATKLFQLSSDIMTLMRAENYAAIVPLNDELYAEFDRLSGEIIKCREAAN